MGIPSFFRQIIESYSNTHKTELKTAVDYFFIDFNSIVYDIYYGIDKTKINTTTTRFETYLASETIKRIQILVNKVVKPQKMLYVAFDGSAPRAKMVQQRWRRFKSVKDAKYFNELKTKYGIDKDNIDWNSSANISPGTKFMKKMSKMFRDKMDSFIKENANLKIILSDSNVPGEGEHKFLPLIRDELSKTDDTLVIYSPDADMIVLTMATHKNNAYILRKVRTDDEVTNVEKEYQKMGKEYLFLSIDEYRKAFIDTLDIKHSKNDPIRLITDYVFLTFLGGNDFVMAIPYLQVKEQKKTNGNSFSKSGLGILLNAYSKFLSQNHDYLVLVDYSINHKFLTEIFEEIVKSEDYYMRGIQMRINRTMEGQGDDQKLAREEGLTLYDRDKKRYEHYEYYSQLHPFYSEHKNLFKKFDFMKPKHHWKPLYYEHFFNLDPKNIQEFNEYRTKICMNYLESLVFTLKYYFEGVPSWTYYYHYRAPPLMSDLLTNMQKYITDINKIKLEKGEPYKPFVQLMMILPSELGTLLPKGYQALMKNELLDYYPIDFEMDVFLGRKQIYSEPVLPPIDDKRVMEETSKVKLTKEEKERNTISYDVYASNV